MSNTHTYRQTQTNKHTETKYINTSHAHNITNSRALYIQEFRYTVQYITGQLPLN